MIPALPQWICATLMGGGAIGVMLSARLVAEQEALDHPVNPLGINRSPYGEILAMAMQEPIDTFWHQGAVANHAPDAAKRESPCSVCGMDQGCGHHVSGERRADPATPQPWNERLRVFLEELDGASVMRTNTHRASKALDFHIRRQVENKLRFAYQLDPAHYGNYNSLHFFLTEPQVGTRPVLTPKVAQLAHDTIDYGLAEKHDPRPSLTAAAAATNVIHLMFADQHNPEPVFTPGRMRESLSLLDQCIARHLSIREAWIARGHDALLSPLRTVEMEERFTFVKRIRAAAEIAIIRFEEDARKGAEADGNSLKKSYPSSKNSLK